MYGIAIRMGNECILGNAYQTISGFQRYTL